MALSGTNRGVRVTADLGAIDVACGGIVVRTGGTGGDAVGRTSTVAKVGKIWRQMGMSSPDSSLLLSFPAKKQLGGRLHFGSHVFSAAA